MSKKSSSISVSFGAPIVGSAFATGRNATASDSCVVCGRPNGHHTPWCAFYPGVWG